jgi:hypothetical protein
MARPWLRLYRSTLQNPKVQFLKPELFRAWVNILCCTNDDGSIPKGPDLSFHLRITEERAAAFVAKLSHAGLLDRVENGFIAHDWDIHQPNSDTDPTARDRKRKQRDKEKDVTRDVTRDDAVLVTRTDTDTDTDTDTEKNRVEPARARPKAQRWPADAVVPDDWILEGLKARDRNHMATVDLNLEAQAFANYWASKSGKDATKVDWKRTWINWVLNSKGKSHGTAKPTQLEQLAAIASAGSEPNFDD